MCVKGHGGEHKGHKDSEFAGNDPTSTMCIYTSRDLRVAKYTLLLFVTIMRCDTDVRD